MRAHAFETRVARWSASCSPRAPEKRLLPMMDLLQQNVPMLDAEMTDASRDHDTVGSSHALDLETLALVRLAGIISACTASQVRESLTRANAVCRPEWVEEVLLQSYLFAGFPRALNAAREWRRISGRAAPESDEGENFDNAPRWRTE